MVKETKGNTAVAVRDSAQVEGFISQAIAANAPVETMERLFDLRSKVKAELAKEEFTKALGQFQQDCPVIKKTRKVLNKDGKTVRYQFAPLEGIAEQIKKPMKDNGLSYSWDTKRENDAMVVTCKLTHVLGHFETSTLEIPIDKDGFMTAPQKVASATTFAKRYTLLNVTGITTADEDTDSVDVGKERTPRSEKSKIIFLLRTLKKDTSKKETIEKDVKKLTSLELEEKNYPDIVARLEALVEEMRGI